MKSNVINFKNYRLMEQHFRTAKYYLDAPTKGMDFTQAIENAIAELQAARALIPKGANSENDKT